MTMSPRVWQVGAGDVNRDYSGLFRQYDVMLLGPGDYGAYPDAEASYDNAVAAGHLDAHTVAKIRKFRHDVSAGDIVLMRRGHRVEGLGVAHLEGYAWLPTFDDVFGWDLQHTRRVVWQERFDEELRERQARRAIFGRRKQIPAFTEVHDQHVLNEVRDLFARASDRPLRDLPGPPPLPLSLEELGARLFEKGLGHRAVHDVVAAIQRQRNLLSWYRGPGRDSGRPTETEVVAYVVVPLLLALGWSEQLLALEWRKIDLAAFAATPTTADRCVLVCEAKGMWHGLDGVLGQAKEHVARHSLAGVKKILVTQGDRLYLHERGAQGWRDDPTGYLNVEKIRTSHLAPKGTSAVDTVMALTPFAIDRAVGS